MRLLIVIVNYRTADLTIDCLRSLAPELADWPDTSARVVVTDNLSGDGSIERVGEAIRANGWSDWATTMPLAQNGGFAYGNNAAIRPALAASDRPDYVLLLNPDTVIRPGAVRTLVEFMESHPRAGIAGSRLEDPDGTVQRSLFRFPTVLNEFNTALRLGLVNRLLGSRVIAPKPPEGDATGDWVAGASMIVRGKVFDDVGLMDEKYFMYYEEVDFCRAAARAGWQCWYVPASRVVHLVGAASQISDSRKHRKRRPTYWFDSRRRYFVKNHGVVYAALADLSFATGFGLWRVRRAIQRKQDTDPPKLLSDLLRNSVFVRGATV